MLCRSANKNGCTMRTTIPPPMPGASNEKYFPYLQRKLNEWLLDHPNETTEGMHDMAILGICMREIARIFFGKEEDPEVVLEAFQEWALQRSS
jgi:hypothetical protein